MGLCDRTRNTRTIGYCDAMTPRFAQPGWRIPRKMEKDRLLFVRVLFGCGVLITISFCIVVVLFRNQIIPSLDILDDVVIAKVSLIFHKFNYLDIKKNIYNRWNYFIFWKKKNTNVLYRCYRQALSSFLYLTTYSNTYLTQFNFHLFKLLELQQKLILINKKIKAKIQIRCRVIDEPYS